MTDNPPSKIMMNDDKTS